ncbi:hypothetical protein FRZ67_21510 [Panacibacter ginsenosidivorans]|uniref:Anti-sigma factor n=1 Tax=Panacibacter ginsenosidivorans TaxID=1813871 RepID=A0A5B8VGB8_9BACT|nr:hypothetical protein FRZ67_21510 [Panacibacter ginsenosidivorans]
MVLNSCSRKVSFNNSSVVPAAEGSVKVKKDKNSNYAISINIERLADASRLQPAREYYVVWIETENNGIKNIGQLKSSSSLFSNALKGSLETVTSFKPKKVFITAENNTNIQYPGEQVVLSTNNF